VVQTEWEASGSLQLEGGPHLFPLNETGITLKLTGGREVKATKAVWEARPTKVSPSYISYA